MTLINRARHLLTCDELRGQLPDEVTAFLREVVALEPTAWFEKSRESWLDDGFSVAVVGLGFMRRKPPGYDKLSALYTLETSHDR